MTRPRIAIRLSTFVFVVIPLACGVRGPPVPPIVLIPDQVSDLSAERFGDEVYLRLTIPTPTADPGLAGGRRRRERARPASADLDRVEVYALTTQPAEDQPRLSEDEWLELATLVATLEVERPDPDDDAESSDVDGERQYALGDQVTLVEVLTAEVRVPVEIAEADEREDPEEPGPDEASDDDVSGPLASPPLPQLPRRTYIARGVSTRGREGQSLTRVAVPLGPAPEPPGFPAVTYTAETVSIAWIPPATARLPVQQQLDGTLPSITLLPPQTPSRYEVYDLTEPGPEVDPETDAETDVEEAGMAVPMAVNGLPLEVTSYTAGVPTFGVERCFAVRTIDVADPVDELVVRSAPSEKACIMLVDTFPPAPPTGLVAVASDGAISLTWTGNTEDDVVGYVVLRGSASGATLDPLVTELVTATNFRDTSVEVGERYAYAVQAIDNATLPNMSTPSLRVVEQAR